MNGEISCTRVVANRWEGGVALRPVDVERQLAARVLMCEAGLAASRSELSLHDNGRDPVPR